MAGENNGADNKGADGKNQIDVEKMKQEILDANKASMEDLKNNILATINENKKVEEPMPDDKIVIDDPEMKEFENELAELNTDPKQAKALLNLIGKYVGKRETKIKEDAVGIVDDKLSRKSAKAEADNLSMQLFPDVINKNSPLFKQAQIEFKKLPEEVRKSAVGESTAVYNAAAILGISPLNLKDRRAFDASNPIDGNGKPRENKEKSCQAGIDLAAEFGIKKEVYEAKLKEVRGN